MIDKMIDWKKFHKDLDVTTATMIQERIDEDGEFLPGKIPLLDFMEYSFKKAKFKKGEDTHD